MSWKDRFPRENRYFETENGILYCGDCLEIMKKFSDKKSENNPRNFHPSAKDVNAFEFLLCLLSNEGDLVLDPFLGSGTTAIACERLNRKWLGIEINPKYCEITRKRVLREFMKILRV